ncbi:hypothetical protein TBR22_A41520 [Luteitalea sp. TBR-22]|uniref:gasdermin n=1 Tax=Luteitalea sp. TBR-22 TaxID=2802971 RepID=UPI001AFB09E5|nr:hypothetical protein [Luteitalea sp. TBR-22]BCS34926.1 hypothetical protein TBR22_A41520 [Luteitalea sp. TBR-22]
MSRPDQSITFLRNVGYSVFRVPRPGAQPLDVLHRTGKDLTRLGGVADLVEPGAVAVPEIRRDDTPGVNIEGTESSKVNVAIGVTILGSFIGALGGGNLGVTTGFSRARTVTFTYAAVVEDRVDVLALERFVKAGRISPLIPSGTVDKLIDDEVYVITSVLKTRKIIVRGHAEGGNSVALDVPVIQQAVGANIKVGIEGASQVDVTFEGPIAIPFAFQAVQLVFDSSGEFLTTEALKAGEAAARAMATPAVSPGQQRYLTAPGAFVRMAG